MTPGHNEDGRSRLPHLRGTLIFESTWSGSLEQKAVTLGVGALFWSVWVAMWMPVLTLGLWTLGPLWGAAQFRYSVDDNVLTLALIGVTGVFLGAALSLWGTVQWLQGLARPQGGVPAPVALDQLAAFHKVDSCELATAWAHRRLVIHHDAEGRVTGIEPSHPTNLVA